MLPPERLQQAASPLQYSVFGPPVAATAATGAQFGASLALLKAPFTIDRAQLVVGAPGMMASAGAVFIFTRATSSGTLAYPAYSPLTGSSGSSFGTALATADVNGDGLDDLVIGAPGGVGYAEVHLGRSDGGVDPTAITLPAPGEATGFGSVIALGDVNNDGKADIAVASTSGLVAVYFAPGGAPILLDAGIADSLLMVNLDEDGGDELVVGAASGLTLSVFGYDGDGGMQALATRTPSPVVPSYGRALTFWQNTGSPIAAMVGAPQELSVGLTTGAVYTLATGPVVAPPSDPGTKIGGDTAMGLFGAALANVGHANGDPTADILVGAPGAAAVHGSIYLYSTSGTDIASLEWQDSQGAAQDSFGAAVAGGLSVDADNSIDLVVGAPHADAGVGQIYVYYGSNAVMAMPDAGVDCSSNGCPVCQQCIQGSCVDVGSDPACVNNLYCKPLSCMGGNCIQTKRCPYDCNEAQGLCYAQNQAEIVDNASRTATVGLPYQYNQNDTVKVNGTTPINVTVCDVAPTGFTLTNGVVAWTPTAPGPVSICIEASNSIGEDELKYVVTVSAAGTPPMASLQVTPTSGQLPLHVQVNGTMSKSATMWSWDFGDMSSPASGPIADHYYLLPGSFPLTLTVGDGVTRNTARQIVSVVDAAGNVPPTARLVVAPGNAPAFTCDCDAGSSDIVAYAWDFEDRTIMQPPPLLVPSTYAAGLHRLRLRVIDVNGLVANDATFFEGASGTGSSAELMCRLSVDPPAGNAPLSIAWSALPDGGPSTRLLTLPGSTPADVTTPIAQSCPMPGVYRAQLDATLGPMKCTDFAYATATAEFGQAPVIAPIDTLRVMACTGTAELQPIVTGTRPITFTLQGPAGAQVDKTTGKVTWQAPLVAEYQLTAANSAGSSSVTFAINSSCDDVTPPDGGEVVSPPMVKFQTEPCGCGTRDASAVALAALLVLTRRRKLSPARA